VPDHRGADPLGSRRSCGLARKYPFGKQRRTLRGPSATVSSAGVASLGPHIRKRPATRAARTCHAPALVSAAPTSRGSDSHGAGSSAHATAVGDLRRAGHRKIAPRSRSSCGQRQSCSRQGPWRQLRCAPCREIARLSSQNTDHVVRDCFRAACAGQRRITGGPSSPKPRATDSSLVSRMHDSVTRDARRNRRALRCHPPSCGGLHGPLAPTARPD